MSLDLAAAPASTAAPDRRAVAVERVSTARLRPEDRLDGRTQPAAREAAANPAGRSAGGDDEATFGFWDFVDIVNPLQHIPGVNWIYREITGDEIRAPARVFGGALFGGPIGMIAAIADTALEGATGGTLSDHAVALATGQPVDPPGATGTPGRETPGSGTPEQGAPERELATPAGPPAARPDAPPDRQLATAGAAEPPPAEAAGATAPAAASLPGGLPIAGAGTAAGAGAGLRFFDLAEAPRRPVAAPAAASGAAPAPRSPVAIPDGLDAALTRLAAETGRGDPDRADPPDADPPPADPPDAAPATTPPAETAPAGALPLPPEDVPRAMAEALARYNQAAAATGPAPVLDDRS